MTFGSASSAIRADASCVMREFSYQALRQLMPLRKQLADCKYEVAWGEWLFKKWKIILLVPRHTLAGAGNEQDRQMWICFEQLACERRTIHSRHRYVADEHVDFARV